MALLIAASGWAVAPRRRYWACGCCRSTSPPAQVRWARCAGRAVLAAPAAPAAPAGAPPWDLPPNFSAGAPPAPTPDRPAEHFPPWPARLPADPRGCLAAPLSHRPPQSAAPLSPLHQKQKRRPPVRAGGLHPRVRGAPAGAAAERRRAADRPRRRAGLVCGGHQRPLTHHGPPGGVGEGLGECPAVGGWRWW